MTVLFTNMLLESSAQWELTAFQFVMGPGYLLSPIFPGDLEPDLGVLVLCP